MSIIQGSAMQGASRGFYPKTLTGSLRFNDDDSAYLSWTPDSNPTGAGVFTFSCWFKIGNLGVTKPLFYVYEDGSNFAQIAHRSDNKIGVYSQAGASAGLNVTTQALFRDPSAWYHLLVKFNSTSGNLEIKVYINGVNQSLTTTTAMSVHTTKYAANGVQHWVGTNFNQSSLTDGYMAEVFFIDGTAHDADAFGETKAGNIWVPKNITATDFTMGTNGFHLTFEDDTEVEAFNTVLWKGNSTYGNSITGTGFNPDLVWVKSRTGVQWHHVFDTVRGGQRRLYANSTDAEGFLSNSQIVSFDSDGFTVAEGENLNSSSNTYVAWCWDAGANNASTGHSSVTYTGSITGTESQTISGLPFQPDLLWIKRRDSSNSHRLFDSVRGSNNYLESNGTGAEASDNTNGTIDSFQPNGFIVDGGSTNSNPLAESGATYVAWAWDAGDSDPVSNTDGSITSTVKTNGDFSIITYTGTGANATVGHGLTSAPDMIVVKNRDLVDSWLVKHVDLADDNKALFLNETSAAGSSSTYWNNTAPTSSVFSVGSDGKANGSGQDMIVYAWRNVTGKQKFGSYTGNGSADGPEVTLGFRPGFVMLKRTNDTSNWRIYDSSRNPLNDVSHDLYPDTSDSEGTTDAIRFTDDGFKLVFAGGTGLNTSGSTYIYAAFAGSYSDYITDYNTDGSIDSRVKASDTTGFSIVSYVGTGANATVGHGLSAAPDMIIVKRREAASAWEVQHSALGAVANQDISLNETTGAASGGVERWHQLPTSSVFSVGTGSNTNASGEGMIAYCWTATAGVSAFGSYSGGTNPKTVTTGFRPSLILVKCTSFADQWHLIDSTRDVTNPVTGSMLFANLSAAEADYSAYPVDFIDTGFTIKHTAAHLNQSGATYIYAAFADTRDAAFWLDQSSNDNDWQPVNLDHNDTVSDSPTDNFATWNPITGFLSSSFNGTPSGSLSDGNLTATGGGSQVSYAWASTVAASSGKFYAEFYPVSENYVQFGVGSAETWWQTYGQGGAYKGQVWGDGVVSWDRTIYYINSTSSTSGGVSFSGGDVCQIAFDADTRKVWFGVNNVWNGGGNPSAGTGEIGTVSGDDPLVFICRPESTTVTANFGQQPFKYGPPE